MNYLIQQEAKHLLQYLLIFVYYNWSLLVHLGSDLLNNINRYNFFILLMY